MVLFPLTPLSRCGSVVLDFMMKFNQSVIVSNVLTFLSDAARQGKFGAFKVDPGSIKQVFNGLESTTQGKYHKGRWLVFPKVFTGIISFENDGLFYLYSESIFFKQPFLRERGKVWVKFDMTSFSHCCRCFYSIKQNLVLENFIGRECLNFSQYQANQSLPFVRS